MSPLPRWPLFLVWCAVIRSYRLHNSIQTWICCGLCVKNKKVSSFPWELMAAWQYFPVNWICLWSVWALFLGRYRCPFVCLTALPSVFSCVHAWRKFPYPYLWTNTRTHTHTRTDTRRHWARAKHSDVSVQRCVIGSLSVSWTVFMPAKTYN